MWRGAVVALAAVATTGCDRISDPISSSIFFGAEWDGRVTDVSGHLPSSGADAVRRLAEFGYQPDTDLAKAAVPIVGAGDGHSILEAYYVPEISRVGIKERLYLLKSFGGQSSVSEGFGIILDLDDKGEVVTATGFKAYWFFH